MSDQRTFTRGISSNEYQLALSEALARGECASVEFKQTFFLNTRRLESDPTFDASKAVDEAMVHEVGKTITAFMNASGGILLIGVKDDGVLYGVENEFPYVPGSKKNIDGWELLLWSKLDAAIDSFGRIRGGISGSAIRQEDHYVFVIIVKPITKSICICRDLSSKIESVYVRNGNNSNRLRLREVEDLVLLRARLSS